MKKILGYTIRNAEEETDLQSITIETEKVKKEKNKVIDEKNEVIRRKNDEIKDLKNIKEQLEKDISSMTDEKANIISKHQAELDERTNKINHLLEKQRIQIGKIGGLSKSLKEKDLLIKDQNVVISELKNMNQKLEEEKNNLSEELKKNHIKKSPSQYDRKIITVEQQKKKM